MLRMEGKERLDILKQLTDIIHEELDLDKQLIGLCEKDSRLGFHSEAEGYKYFPEKIRWRMHELEYVLSNDVPEIKKLIGNDKLLFPEYTGKEPVGLVAYATRAKDSVWPDSGLIFHVVFNGSHAAMAGISQRSNGHQLMMQMRCT